VKKNALHFGVRALALVLGIVFVVGRADTNATFRANALAPKICGVAGHAGLKLDGVRVKSITERPAGNLTLSGAPMLTSLPAFCRVEAVVETGSDSLINFEVWLPAISKWNWWSFDFDRDLAHAVGKVGGMIDQINPNIRAFKARGGKAIVYHGWQDPVSNPLDTIAYYDRVKTLQGSQQETEKFFRLFLVPGMGHCSGGTGTTNFGNQGAQAPIGDAEHDLLAALDNWVEKGVVPEKIIASKVINGVTVRTRPLCPYPRRAVYKGSGSTDDAANFTCRADSSRPPASRRTTRRLNQPASIGRDAL